MVSGRGGIVQSCWVVWHGMHAGQERMVCALAGRLFLNTRSNSLYNRPVLRAPARANYWLVFPTGFSRVKNCRGEFCDPDLELGFLAAVDHHQTLRSAGKRRNGGVL